MPHARTLFFVVALFAVPGVLPAQSANQNEIKAEYRERMKKVRKSSDPKAWLRLGDWVERQSVREKTKKDWLKYTRHQYGVAASKRIRDNDVDGWLRLARELDGLLGESSPGRGYLKKGLEKNPHDERLQTALSRTKYGPQMVAGIVFNARLAEAEKRKSAAAFRELAIWCKQQIANSSSAEEWYEYAYTRALYLSGRGGSLTDPIRRAFDRAAKKSASPTRAAREPQVGVGSHLPKRKWKGLDRGEYKRSKRYRLESGGEVGYSDSPPDGSGYDAVWERGNRTSTTLIGSNQVMFQDHKAWWRLQWDPEVSRWVPHTRADKRAARVKQIAQARERLSRAERQLERAKGKRVSGPDKIQQARERAERIAREGGKVRDFTRALRSIVNSAGSAHYEGAKQADAARAVAEWRKKIAELEATPPR